MEVKYILDSSYDLFVNNNFLGFFGEEKDLLMLEHFTCLNINKGKVKKYKLDKKYLDILELDEEYILKKVSNLSSTEFKILSLLYIVNLNPKVIYLDDFDLGFNHKYKSKLSKVLRMINADKHINFVIKSTDTVFLSKLCKKCIILKDRSLIYEGEIINAINEGFIEKNEIINFIIKANLKGAKIKYTLDEKELLKSIYRSVF